MVAKLSDVPKTSRLQCPNCSRSIVAPPNCEMFKCICGQTMVVPGSEMAKKIQQQGTRKGESIFVQDKSEMVQSMNLCCCCFFFFFLIALDYIFLISLCNIEL